MGTTRRLHDFHRKIHCVAAEPAEAMHGLEGLKHMASSIVPGIYDPNTPDEILPITTEAGWDMAERVGEEEGLFVGHSGGANIAAAVMLAERAHKEQGGGCVVTVACDRGDRYFDPVRWEEAGRAAYARDEEACGYLAGSLAEPLHCDEAVELENLANKYHKVDPEGHPRTGHDYFKINGLKFEKAIEQAKGAGRAVKVFFHSHLDCGAYFSSEDAASMTMGGDGDPSYELAYLVTAVDRGEVTAHRLFVWNGTSRSFVEAPFERID
jgi:proteasome lid subunit RPN8/RPN11